MTNFSFKCVQCGKEGYVIVRFIQGKKLQQICYCKEHAQEAELLNFKIGYQLIEGNDYLQSQIEQQTLTSETCCPDCNRCLSDILKEGKVGCRNCYKIFKKDLQEHWPHPYLGGQIPSQSNRKEVLGLRIKYFKEQEKIFAECNEFIMAASYNRMVHNAQAAARK